MHLSEFYISKLKNLAGIISENRIDKLRAEKYPEDIINFVINFARETTKDDNAESVSKNQYIPWIASQAKNNPNIINDNNKLNVIIHWIKNSGYNKINSTESFEKIYEKAKEWLRLKNIDLNTGERVEGGKVVKKYSNGFQWIQATEVNWCINAGEKHGWCFNQLNRAEQFVGLGNIGAYNKGYFLLNDKHEPIIALQYDSKAKEIVDIQGTHNTPLNAQLLPYAYDLFKLLPEITDIKGHTGSFWKSFGFEGGNKFKQELLKISNINFNIAKKLQYQLPLSQQEIDSLPVYQKLRFEIPLTKEEIRKLDIDDKVAYNYATEAELKALPIHKKIEYALNLTASDYAKIRQPILKKLTQIIKKEENPKDLFIKDNFEEFKSVIIDDDDIKLEIDEDEFAEKYSGLDEYERNYLHYDGSDEYLDDDDLTYMSHYLDKENLDKIKYLAKILGVPNKYDFEEPENLYKFIEEKLQNFENIFDAYKSILGSAIGESKEKSIEHMLETKQKFKYINGYLVLPYKKLYKFIKDNPDKTINTFKDLENAEINGEISLENAISDYQEISDKNIELLNNEIGYQLDKSLEIIESNPGYSENVDEFYNIIKSLKFEEGNFTIYAPTLKGHAIYKLELSNKTIFIQGVDYAEKKISIFIIEYTGKTKKKVKKMLKGKIPFENLVNYTQQYFLFENKIREKVREILAEDFRYLYDTNTFTPTREVVQTAQKAIQTVQNNKLVQSDASNEGSGLKKANSLAKAEPMTHAQLKRMKAFFDNNTQAVQAEKNTGKNINNSPLIQKWELWGGDAGKNWAEKEINSTQSSNQTSKKVRNSDMIARDNRIMDPHNTRIKR